MKTRIWRLISRIFSFWFNYTEWCSYSYNNTLLIPVSIRWFHVRVKVLIFVLFYRLNYNRNFEFFLVYLTQGSIRLCCLSFYSDRSLCLSKMAPILSGKALYTIVPLVCTPFLSRCATWNRSSIGREELDNITLSRAEKEKLSKNKFKK